MAEVGTYYITIMPEMSQFTGQVKSALGSSGTESGKEYSTSFLDVIKGSALGSALGNLASKAGSAIASGFGTGVRRLDTIKNFPKVMEALGYSTDDADKSIQTIMDHLDGLPTATQEMVTLTQAISDSTGDLDLATRAALGFNDMMLANGASSAEAATAQAVLNRILGKGSATAAQWGSLTAVMPAQLGMVARAMLGAGATTEDLHTALDDGTVSWNDFLRAVADLDESGYVDEAGKQFASFEEQARANSHGIGTAIDNVRNRIGAGWADILDTIGREDIAGAIDTTSYGIRNAMYAVGDGIGYLKDKIGETSIVQNAAKVFDTLGSAISGLWNDGGPAMLKGIADGIINLIDGALQWLADHGDVVTTAVWGIAGALAALAGWQLGAGIAALPGLLAGIGTALMANPFGLVVGAIAAVTAALYGFFTQTETGKAIWQGFCDLLSTTWAGLQEDWALLMGVLSQEWESFKTFIDGIPAWWAGIVDAFNAKVDEWKQWWSQSWDEAVKSVKTAGSNIVTGATTAWTNLKTNTTAKWNEIKTNTTTAWTNLKTTVTNKANEAKTAATQAWDNLKTSTLERWNNIKTSVSEKAGAIKDAVVDKFNGLKSSVTDTWNNIKTSISDKITAAKNKVSEMVNAIKNLFNFHVSWPHIPLPHFSVSGSANPLDWLTNGVPSISVSWYAKGAIFTKPTVLPGFGDVREAAIPLNRKSYGEIAHGIEGEMGNSRGVVITGNNFYIREELDIDRVADKLNRKISRERWAMA